MKAWEDDAIYTPRNEASEGTNPIDTLVSDFQPPEVWDGHFGWVSPRPCLACGTLSRQPGDPGTSRSV